MTVHIRTLRNWRYRLDPDGNAVREHPRGRTYSVEDHIGLLAIAEGAAEPTVPLSAQQQFELDVITASLAGDEAAVSRLLGETPKESAPAKAAVMPAPTKRGRR